MKLLQQDFTVRFQYTIHFTEGLFKYDNPIVKELFSKGLHPRKKLLCVVDDAVFALHPYLEGQLSDYLKIHLPDVELAGNQLHVVKGGEECKNDLKYTYQVIDWVNEYGIDRHSYLMAIGGGALLDMAGYAAAISHRGIRHIRVPTTVLSQNDSGIGVKNSVNYESKKNFLGTFTPPIAVLNDFTFLSTLEHRDWIAGISEAIKVALIKDKDFFAFLRLQSKSLREHDTAAMQELIFVCAKLHMEHIGGKDPFETGSSRPLDFGHWSAHKLEQISNFSIRHGEAVAVGIALDSTYSYLSGRLPEYEWNQILDLLLDLGLSIYIPELETMAAGNYVLIEGLREFREHLGGQLTVMLLDGIGKGVEVHELTENTILQAIQTLKSYNHYVFSHS